VIALGRVRTAALLARAAETGDCGALEGLLAAGAPPDAGSWSSARCSPLHLAARHDQAGAIGVLAAHGASLDLACMEFGSALAEAAAYGQCQAAQALLEAGARVDVGDCEGRTPLYIAAEYGQAEAARLLLGAGAAPDGLPGRSTPLAVTRAHGHAAVAAILRAHGANDGPGGVSAP